MPTRPRPTSTNAIRSAPVLGSRPETGVAGLDETGTDEALAVVGGVLTSRTWVSGVVDDGTAVDGGTELDGVDDELVDGAEVVDEGIGGVVVAVGWHPGTVVVERGGRVEVTTVDVVVAGPVVDGTVDVVLVEHTSDVVVVAGMIDVVVDVLIDVLIDVLVDVLVSDELVDEELVDDELVEVAAGAYV